MGPGGCRCRCRCGGTGGICPSIHPRRYMYMYCTVPTGPLRASTFFWRGSFLCFLFSWIAWGNLQQQQQKSVWFFLYLPFFREGKGGSFWYCCCCCWVLLGSLFLFPGRASLEEGLEERSGRGKERRERQYKVYFPTIFFRPRREKKRSTFGKVGRKSIGFFVFIYFYVLYIYIYYLVVFS